LCGRQHFWESLFPSAAGTHRFAATPFLNFEGSQLKSREFAAIELPQDSSHLAAEEYDYEHGHYYGKSGERPDCCNQLHPSHHIHAHNSSQPASKKRKNFFAIPLSRRRVIICIRNTWSGVVPSKSEFGSRVRGVGPSFVLRQVWIVERGGGPGFVLITSGLPGSHLLWEIRSENLCREPSPVAKCTNRL